MPWHKRVGAISLSNPNGIRTRAATLKGWTCLQLLTCEIPH